MIAMIALATFLLSSRAHAQQTGPTISDISITSSPVNASYYTPRQPIRIAVRFSEPVSVTGSPVFLIDVGRDERLARFEEVVGDTIVFIYVVTKFDFDNDGIAFGQSPLRLRPGDGISSLEGAAASLTHPAVGDASDHKVNLTVVTIVSNDNEPVPEDETPSFTVFRTGDISEPLTINLTNARKGRFTGSRAVPRSAIIKANQSSVTFKVRLINDAHPEEEDGYVIITIAPGSGYLVGVPGDHARADLTDNNDVVFTFFSAIRGTLLEGHVPSYTAGITFTTRTHREKPPETTVVTLHTQGLTATPDTSYNRGQGDYTPYAAEYIIRPHQWDMRRGVDPAATGDHRPPITVWWHPLDYQIPIIDDDRPEPTEQFLVQIESSRLLGEQVFDVALPYTSIVTILDDERAFDVDIAASTLDMVEGDELTLELTATTQYPVTQEISNLSFNVAMVDGTATHLSDFLRTDTDNLLHASLSKQPLKFSNFEAKTVDGEERLRSETLTYHHSRGRR